MAEQKFMLRPVCSVKFNREEIIPVSEAIARLNPQYDETTTFKAVFKDLLSRAENGTGLQEPGNAKELQLLQNEIGRLKIMIDNLNDEKEQLQESFAQVTEERDLALASSLSLAENQTIFTWDPAVLALVREEQAERLKHTGKPVSEESIIKNCFFDTAKRETGYPLTKAWTSGQIIRTIEKYKTAVQ